MTAAAVVCAAASGVEAAASGYLPRIGPSALHFQAPPTAAPCALPPLQLTDSPAPALASADATAGSTNSTAAAPTEEISESSFAGMGSPTESASATSADGQSPPPPGATGSAAATPPGAFPEANLQGVVTSQMLLPFFRTINSATNTAQNSIFVPVQFVPPTPLVPPSSRATYHSP